MSNRGTQWKCKDAVISFNKASDKMREQAIEDGMIITEDFMTEQGHKCFYASVKQDWTPEKGHKPYFGVYSFISAHIADFGNGQAFARISYAFPATYGHAPIYTDQYNQK